MISEFTDALARLRNPAQVPLAARALVLAAGIVLALVPAHLTLYGVAGVLVAVLIGLIAPHAVGSTLATAVFVTTYVITTGWSDVTVVRTVLAAAALYVLHTGLAFAACVPLSADVSPAALHRWRQRSVLPLTLAAVVVLVDELVPRGPGSVGLELIGLVGIVLLAVGVAVLVTRRPIE